MSDVPEFEVPLPRLAAWLKRHQYNCASDLPNERLLDDVLIRFLTDAEGLDGLGLKQSAEHARVLVLIKQAIRGTAVWELVLAAPALEEVRPSPAVAELPAADQFPEDIPLPEGFTREDAILIWQAYIASGRDALRQLRLSTEVFPGKEDSRKRNDADLWLRFAAQGVPFRPGDHIPGRFREQPPPKPAEVVRRRPHEPRPRHRCDHHEHHDDRGDSRVLPLHQPAVSNPKPSFLGNPKVTLAAMIFGIIFFVIAAVELWLLMKQK